MYYDWLCSPDTCMLCWTPADTHDLIGHLILLLTALITVHLCFVCYFILFQYIFSSYAHTLYARAPSLLFLHIHWEFWLSRFAYPSLYMLSYWSDIWRGSQTSWRAGVLLLDHLFSVFSVSSLFLSLTLCIGLSTCLILLFICYHCARHYMCC